MPTLSVTPVTPFGTASLPHQQRERLSVQLKQAVENLLPSLTDKLVIIRTHPREVESEYELALRNAEEAVATSVGELSNLYCPNPIFQLKGTEALAGKEGSTSLRLNNTVVAIGSLELGFKLTDLSDEDWIGMAGAVLTEASRFTQQIRLQLQRGMDAVADRLAQFDNPLVLTSGLSPILTLPFLADACLRRHGFKIDLQHLSSSENHRLYDTLGNRSYQGSSAEEGQTAIAKLVSEHHTKFRNKTCVFLDDFKVSGKKFEFIRKTMLEPQGVSSHAVFALNAQRNTDVKRNENKGLDIFAGDDTNPQLNFTVARLLEQFSGRVRQEIGRRDWAQSGFGELQDRSDTSLTMENFSWTKDRELPPSGEVFAPIVRLFERFSGRTFDETNRLMKAFRAHMSMLA